MKPHRFAFLGILLILLLVGSVSGHTEYTPYTGTWASSYTGSYYPYQCFDNNSATDWYTASALPQWIGNDFGASPRYIENYSILHYDGTGYYPSEWRFEGAQDNTTASWTLLDYRTGESFGASEEKVYWNQYKTNNTNYRYYRLFFITGVNTPQLKEIHFFNEGNTTAAPVANFTMSNTTGIAPLIVALTDTSTNTPTGWTWNATNVTGNNVPFTFATSQSPTFTFTLAGGNYSIQLNATNTGGANTTPANTKWVNTSSGATTPIVLWTVNSQTILFPGRLIGNDSSLNTPTAWCWSFGDGSAQVMTKNVTYQYTKRGLWNASLNASNAAGYNQSYKLIRSIGFLQGAGPGAPLPGVPWREQASAEYGTFSASRELTAAEKARTECKLFGLCEG